MIVYESGDFGYVKRIQANKFEVIINGNTHAKLAGTRTTLEAAKCTLDKLVKYPSQTHSFLGILK